MSFLPLPERSSGSAPIQEKTVSFKNVSTIIPILLAAFILQYSHETRRREVIGLTASEQKDIYAIGVRVYNLRKDLGLTREALAGICDLSVNTIASIESGAKDIKATTLMPARPLRQGRSAAGREEARRLYRPDGVPSADACRPLTRVLPGAGLLYHSFPPSQHTPRWWKYTRINTTVVVGVFLPDLLSF